MEGGLFEIIGAVNTKARGACPHLLGSLAAHLHLPIRNKMFLIGGIWKNEEFFQKSLSAILA